MDRRLVVITLLSVLCRAVFFTDAQAAPQLKSAAIMAVTGSDADQDGYYETFSFEFELAADSEEGSSYGVAARIYCAATNQGWYTQAWPGEGADSEKVFVIFDQSDFILSGMHDLGFTAELWDATFSMKYGATQTVEGEPVKVEASQPPGGAPPPLTLASPTTTSIMLTVNPNGGPADTSYSVQCVATVPLDSAWVGKYVWPLEGRGLRFDVPVWRDLTLWQALPINELQPGTTYTFEVWERVDGVESEGGRASIRTLQDPANQFAILAVSESTISLKLDAADYPGETAFAIQCTATDPFDGSYDQQWIDRCGIPSAEPVWLTAQQWSGLFAAGLRPLTTYTFVAEAGNPDGEITALGLPICARTSIRGDMDGNCSVNIIDLVWIRMYLNMSLCSYSAAAADLNGDGKVNIIDMVACRMRLNDRCPDE